MLHAESNLCRGHIQGKEGVSGTIQGKSLRENVNQERSVDGKGVVPGQTVVSAARVGEMAQSEKHLLPEHEG